MSLAVQDFGFVPFGLSGRPYTTKLNLPSKQSKSHFSELEYARELGTSSSLFFDSLNDSWHWFGRFLGMFGGFAEDRWAFMEAISLLARLFW